MPYAEREKLLLAPYAMHAADSAGRRHPEPGHPYRSPYQRDRDRITHSSAFRRLSHKTQVFTGELGDYHRTRLTHTLEVASIARTIARAMGLNEDLVETLALAHDVGHPPFGHAGEEVLDAFLKNDGGFNHNRQALRIFQRLEVRYADRPGLNLSAEVLEGQRVRGEKPSRNEEQRTHESFTALDMHTGEPWAPLLEVQVVDAADSIAYNSHDADDALELGLLSLGDLEELALWQESSQRVKSRYAALSDDAMRRATVHELIDCQVNDLVQHLRQAIDEKQIDSVGKVRTAGLIAMPSREIAEKKLALEAFLFRRVYRHPMVLESRSEATAALSALLDRWMQEPQQLPPLIQAIAEAESLPRAVADHVSSLTDRAVLDGRRAPY